jgi:hypothetical protein
MENKLHYITAGHQLQSILKTLMAAKEFDACVFFKSTKL